MSEPNHTICMHDNSMLCQTEVCVNTQACSNFEQVNVLYCIWLHQHSWHVAACTGTVDVRLSLSISLCWTIATACCNCCRVAKVVAPKKEKLAAAEAEYGELMTGLNQKKAELAAVEGSLAALNAKLKEMQVCLAPMCWSCGLAYTLLPGCAVGAFTLLLGFYKLCCSNKLSVARMLQQS